jgi:uncharacterized protein (TIGR00251 family)
LNEAFPKFLRPHAQGVVLALKVQPRASRDELGPPLGDELKLKITAPPVDSAANEAIVRFLSDILGCPRNAVRLIRGETSRHKQVLLVGWTAEAAAKKLDAGTGD